MDSMELPQHTPWRARGDSWEREVFFDQFLDDRNPANNLVTIVYRWNLGYNYEYNGTNRKLLYFINGIWESHGLESLLDDIGCLIDDDKSGDPSLRRPG